MASGHSGSPSSFVRESGDGGASVVWYQGDALGLDVFPPGGRPQRTPLFKDDYYGYQAPYGADAYIWLTFK